MVDRRCRSVDQPARQSDELGGIPDWLCDDQELVAAEPGDYVAAAYDRPHAGANLLENGVADMVPVVVVGALEIVEIDAAWRAPRSIRTQLWIEAPRRPGSGWLRTGLVKSQLASAWLLRSSSCRLDTSSSKARDTTAVSLGLPARPNPTSRCPADTGRARSARRRIGRAMNRAIASATTIAVSANPTSPDIHSW